MAESKILSNIDYTIHNYSNYDITKKETEDIIDVPYFPAQNLVDPTGIEVFSIKADKWFLLKDEYNNKRIFGLINKPDMRMTFVEISDNARYLQYRFGGNSFPQGRKKYSITTDGRKIYIGYGECNDRYVNDLWIYDIYTNEWENINFSLQELPINEIPSKRGKTNLVVLPSTIWIFGGETDILKIHDEEEREKNIIPLNDLWYYDKDTKQWFNLDPYRKLPHRQGNIVYVDNNVVKILIVGGTNTIGLEEPTAIWTYNRTTHEVTYTPYTPPFEPNYYNIAFFIDGAIHYLVNGELYKWDDANEQLVLLKSSITTINPIDKDYLTIVATSKYRGNDSLFGEMSLLEANIHDFSTDNVKSTKTITPPINNDTVARVNIGNYQTWFMYGIADTDNNIFNENMFVFNHATLETEKITIPAENRPQERIYPSLCYDRYHSKIWLFGGTDGSKFYNDLWYFDLNTQTWTKVFDGEGIDNNDDFPAPRQKAGICVVVNGNYLYLIGGYSDSHTFNDFWQYNILTNEWTRIYTADNIPYGSQYYIFEWRDRLWLFNGEVDGIYRFFYNSKLFVKQPFVFRGENISSTLKTLIKNKAYLSSPMNITLIDNYLFIHNSEVILRINLETRIVDDFIEDFKFGTDEEIIWLDFYKGLYTKTGRLFYINYSDLFPLTKNQVPSSMYSKKVDKPYNSGFFLFDSINTHQLSYYDDSGAYKIERRYLPLNKAELLVDNLISIAGTTADYPMVDFNDDSSVLNKTIEVLASPKVYPFTYWFLYRKNKPVIDFYKGATKVINDEYRKRIYIIYESGNILKLNPNDMTMFIYHPEFWEGGVIVYNKIKNKFWCFSGIRNGKRTPYTQMGFICEPIEKGEKCKIIEQSHCGIIELDLNVNELSLRSISDYTRNNKVSMIDYTITRDYLVELITKYIEDYESNRSNLSLDEVRQKIYTATQSLVDDMSMMDIIYEKGERPKARAYSTYTQINNDVYIFGGCTSYKKEGECDLIITNSPYFTDYIEFLNESLDNSEKETISKKAYKYNLQRDEWTEIAEMPIWLYLGSAIVDNEGRYIYIVGGYTNNMCKSPFKNILVYDTYSNLYFEIITPKKYRGRAKPILHWIDDNRLLIMYGFRSKLHIVENPDGSKTGTWLHLPVNDAWIYDRKNKIMYRAFQDLLSVGGVNVRDYYVNDEFSKKMAERTQYVLTPIPVQYDSDVNISIFKYDLTNGEVDVINIKPTTELLNDFNFKIVDTDDGGEFHEI